MRKIFTILGLLLTLFVRSQTFTGTGGAILDNGLDTYYTLNVSGLSPTTLDSTFGLEQVCFNITHPNVSELYIYLQSPSGTFVNLTLGSSSAGADFVNTCVNSQNASSITLASSPYTGTFKPVGYLGRFNTGQVGNGNWTLIVHDGFPNGTSGTLASWSLQFGNAPSHQVPFTASGFPIVKITTSQPITDNKSIVDMGIIDNGASANHPGDAFNAYNAKAQIHLHGSSTKNFEKKAFALETQDASGAKLITSLLGMPAESDWMLIASYIDKSLLRIPMTYDVYRRMGHYAPRFRYVELMINNEYQGVYTFMEKVKRDSNRVHVQTMTTASNNFPEVSGGYILKIDRTDAPGWSSLLPGASAAGTHFYYNYVYPKDGDITPQQQAYIKSYVDSFETVMNSTNYADPVNGYSKYIGVNTFIDLFIMKELSKNVDEYSLRTYL
jgi:subtilisin-like proprotein convertase family protein